MCVLFGAKDCFHTRLKAVEVLGDGADIMFEALRDPLILFAKDDDAQM
jgi:hypothetical protein